MKFSKNVHLWQVEGTYELVVLDNRSDRLTTIEIRNDLSIIGF